jgi:hypothetical protein
MGLLDTLKGMLKGNADKVKGGIDKAGDMIDDKTGGKFGDKIEMAEEKVGDMLDQVEEDADDAAEDETES